MKENRLTVDIKRPIGIVFWFTVDPRNTHQWMNDIVREKSSEWPPKKGTFYTHVDQQGASATYVCTSFEENKIFELQELHGTYHVQYRYERKGEGTTLVYFEWVDSGYLQNPFRQASLMKLKSILEK